MSVPLRAVAVALVLSWGMTSALFASDDGATLKAVEGKLRALYPGTRIDRVTSSELPGLYEVAMGKNVAYVDGQGRYFLFGHLYDMKSQRDLTAERTEARAKIDFATLPLKDAIKTVRGNGRRVLAVFSDPDCPYCKALEAELDGLTDATIYTFLFPLDQLHPEARDRAVAIWCADDPAKAWAALMRDGTLPSLRDCPNPVERNVALGTSVGVNGTPTLFSGDGRMKAGAVKTAELIAWLDRIDKTAQRR